MMKKSEADGGTVGGLLLLLSLLLLHAFCIVFCHSADVDVKSDTGVHAVRGVERTAFQKITLGEPVSVNTEGAEGLTAVTGIGPKTAVLITLERKKRGGFKSLDEIQSIRGIGPGLYEKIRPYLDL